MGTCSSSSGRPRRSSDCLLVAERTVVDAGVLSHRRVVTRVLTKRGRLISYMKINNRLVERFELKGFGCRVFRSVYFPDRVTLVAERPGHGRSYTLCTVTADELLRARKVGRHFWRIESGEGGCWAAVTRVCLLHDVIRAHLTAMLALT